MRNAIVLLCLFAGSCGGKPAAVPVEAAPVTAPTPEEVPARFVVRDVIGADTSGECLGKPVVPRPGGLYAIGPGRGAVGVVVTWLEPGVVEVEKPMRGEPR